MNNTLIDQLKLAIQVESGEVPWSEIQYLPKSEDESFGWICVSPLGTPSWNFTNAIYRRKPKPLEFYVSVDEKTLEPLGYHRDHPGSVNYYVDRKVIIKKVREVTE